MKLRLWRVFNLFRRNVLMNFLTLGAIFFLIPLVILALTGTLAGWTFLGLLALNLVWVLTYLLGCPSSLRLEGDTAEFTEYYEVRKGDHKRLHFTVTAVRQVEYRQTAFEKPCYIYKSLPRIPIRNCAVGFLQDLQNVHIFLFRDVDKVFGM